MVQTQAIIVLGMHASGTSLLAHILIELGVNMGRQFTGPVKQMPTWENVEFMKMNVRLLKKAGGNWTKPPAKEKIALAATQFTEPMIALVTSHQDTLWGFKDPRTALTVDVWHPLLDNPKYIYVYRNPESVAASIVQRGPSNKTHAEWVELANEYNASIRDFISVNAPPLFEIEFERLISPKHSQEEVARVAAFIGIDNERLINQACGVIKKR